LHFLELHFTQTSELWYITGYSVGIFKSQGFHLIERIGNNHVMKVLFITLPAPDHITDQIYSGLCTLLGHQNVIDFPSKPTYHDPLAKMWFVPQYPASTISSEEEVVSLIRDQAFSFLCFSPRSYPLNILDSLRKYQIPLPPLVLIDGEEDTKIRYDLWSRYNVQTYFKRDYIWGTRNQAIDFLHAAQTFQWNRRLFAQTHPLPLALSLESIPNNEQAQKEVDISYTGRASHPSRPKAISRLTKIPHLKFEGGLYREPSDHIYKMKPGFTERLQAVPPTYEVPKLSPDPDQQGGNAYYDQIFRSKIAISLRGAGLTPPIRYYEIVACKTLLLSDIPYSIIPNNFINRKHAVFFKRDLSDLIQLAKYYAQHDSEREEIIDQGYQHLLQYHTCEKRAEYFLDICRKAL
jgi:hypothetical protein